jgi:hypothetical protein
VSCSVWKDELGREVRERNNSRVELNGGRKWVCGAHYLRKWDSAGHSTLVNQMRSSESEERNVIAGNGERESEVERSCEQLWFRAENKRCQIYYFELQVIKKNY